MHEIDAHDSNARIRSADEWDRLRDRSCGVWNFAGTLRKHTPQSSPMKSWTGSTVEARHSTCFKYPSCGVRRKGYVLVHASRRRERNGVPDPRSDRLPRSSTRTKQSISQLFPEADEKTDLVQRLKLNDRSGMVVADPERYGVVELSTNTLRMLVSRGSR